MVIEGRTTTTRLLLLPWLLALIALAAGASSLRATVAQDHTEYQVKAAFLFNFAKFVTWPPPSFGDPGSPIVIGVLGDDPFGDDLKRVVNTQRVQGRPIEIMRGQTAAMLAKCHIIFVSASERTRLRQHLAALREARSHALTVSDAEDFLSFGGMIRFVVDQKKVRFEIAAENAAASALTISSKLLSLAVNNRSRS